MPDVRKAVGAVQAFWPFLERVCIGLQGILVVNSIRRLIRRHLPLYLFERSCEQVSGRQRSSAEILGKACLILGFTFLIRVL